jgi:Phosphotransferase enzyme family
VEPTDREREQVAKALKKLRSAPFGWRPVTRGGYTPTRRWVVTLADGSSAFVKVATDELTASWLRDEHLAYSVLRGAPFMPRYLGWSDDGDRPVLALEDLSTGHWPPPWERAHVGAVLETLAAVAGTTPPESTPLAANDAREIGGGWDEVANDPSPFLALGLCEPGWLVSHLEALRAAAADAPFDGDALVHFDVRSDNVCIREGHATLVDWNLTTIGNPQIDVAFWLPSLQAEGGPAPEEVIDVDPRLVAAVGAFFCSRAARPPIADAPRVREIQLVQARTALPWAARALGLPEPAPAR